MTHIPRRPAPGFPALLLTLALAACGGGGGGSVSQSGPVATSPAASTPVVTVPPPATPAGCAPGDSPTVRLSAFGLINVIRTAVSLPEFVRLPALDATAQAHAQYVVANGSAGTEESVGLPCYTGATLAQRLADAGVVPAQLPGTRPHSESVLAYATPAGVEIEPWDIVNGTLNNLYGRLLLLTSRPQQMGVGFSAQPGGQQRALVVDTALPADATAAPNETWVVWPRDGATGLPAVMRAANVKPLDAALTEGYPASLHAGAPVQVSRFVMTNATSGAAVAATVITSATDRNGFFGANEVALVPEAPLAAATPYRVELDGTVGTQPVHLAWTFTTAP